MPPALKVIVESENGRLRIHFARKTLPEQALARTVEVYPGVFLGLDGDGKLALIDLTDTDRLLGSTSGCTTLGPLVGVKEAAEMFGVAKPNFLRDFAAKTGFPAPVAELASGRVWLLTDVLNFLRQHRIAPPEGSIGDLLSEYLKLKEPAELARELEVGLGTIDYLLRDHHPHDRVRETHLTDHYGMSRQASRLLMYKLDLLKELQKAEGRKTGETGGSDPQKRKSGRKTPHPHPEAVHHGCEIPRRRGPGTGGGDGPDGD